MDYKNKLQTNNTALEGNNLDLQTILNTINSLPEAGSGESVNLDAEITAQDALIAELSAILDSKAADSVSYDTCTIRILRDDVAYPKTPATIRYLNATIVENNTISHYYTGYATFVNNEIIIPNVLCNSSFSFYFDGETENNYYFWPEYGSPEGVNGGSMGPTNIGENMIVSYTMNKPNEVLTFYLEVY